MTVEEYIQQKFQPFGIQLSEADLLDISLSSGISGEDEINQSNIGLISVVMAKLQFTFVSLVSDGMAEGSDITDGRR